MRAGHRRIATNAIANYAGQVTILGVGILLTPFIISHLGNSMYGVWALVVAVQGLGGLMDLGVTTSVVKFVAAHNARQERDEISRVVSSSFFLHLGMGTLVFAVTALVAFFAMPLLKLDPAQVDVARRALLVAGASLMFSLPLGVLASLPAGLQRYEITNIVNIAYTLVTAAAILIVLPLGGGPTELIAINGIGLVIAHGIKTYYAARLLPGVTLSVRGADRQTLRRIGGYSLWLFVLDAAKRVFYNADAVMIAAFLPVANVTSYNLGFKPASAVSYLAGPFVQVFLPAASEMEARDEKDKLRALLVTGTRVSTMLTMPAVLWLLAFGRQTLTVWVGQGHEDALPVMYVFLITFLVSASQNPAATILRGIGQVRAIALFVLAEYAVNIALSIILIPRVGVVGAALGTFIPAVINNLVFIPWLVCRALEVDYRDFVRGSLLGPALSAIPALALLWPLSLLLSRASIVNVAAGGAAALVLFAGFYWFLGAGREERRLVISRLRALRPGKQAAIVEPTANDPINK